jgi:hypothetical protein
MRRTRERQLGPWSDQVAALSNLGAMYEGSEDMPTNCDGDPQSEFGGGV